jgi:hypothetical protein
MIREGSYSAPLASGMNRRLKQNPDGPAQFLQFVCFVIFFLLDDYKYLNLKMFKLKIVHIKILKI